MGWLVVAAAALAPGLGSHALIEPDEGRYAAVARAMAESGDYLVPRLNGLPHLDKPVLFYAAGAVSIGALGPSALAARLPALVFTWATVALTVAFAASLFGRSSSWVAGLVCATAPLTIAMARIAIFDSALTFFVVLSLVAFYRGVEATPEPGLWPPARRWVLLAWAAIGCGILTKGPVALVVPLLVVIPYALWRGRARRVLHPAGWLVAALLVLPWALAVERRVPGFTRYALLTETWQRLTTENLHRGGPIWYFLPYLLVGCLPWIVLVLAAATGRRSGRAEERPALAFLVLWVLVPLLFFSVTHSKRPQYVLPLVPALAVLTAWCWSQERTLRRGLLAASFAWLVSGAILVPASFALARRQDMGPELGGAARQMALILGVLLAVCGLLAALCARRRGAAIALLSLPLVALPVLAEPVMVEVGRQRSGRELADVLRARQIGPETRIVGIETYLASLSFYLGRTIDVSSGTGLPFDSNYILGTYATWADQPASTLHWGGWWREVLDSCTRPAVFLLKHRYVAERSILASAGLPVLFDQGGIVVMGPCSRAARASP